MSHGIQSNCTQCHTSTFLPVATYWMFTALFEHKRLRRPFFVIQHTCCVSRFHLCGCESQLFQVTHEGSQGAEILDMTVCLQKHDLQWIITTPKKKMRSFWEQQYMERLISIHAEAF